MIEESPFMEFLNAAGWSHIAAGIIIADWIQLKPQTAQLGPIPKIRPWLRITNGIEPARIAFVYPRASDKTDGAIVRQLNKIRHDSHVEPPHSHGCLINQLGWLVVNGVTPHRVDSPRDLRGNSCKEQDAEWLAAVKARLEARSIA